MPQIVANMAEVDRLPNAFCHVRFVMPEIGLFDAIHSARALRQLQTRSSARGDDHPHFGRRHTSALGGQCTELDIHRGAREGEQRRRLGMIYRKASNIASEMYKARRSAGAYDGRAVSAPADLRGIFVGLHRVKRRCCWSPACKSVPRRRAQRSPRP